MSNGPETGRPAQYGLRVENRERSLLPTRKMYRAAGPINPRCEIWRDRRATEQAEYSKTWEPRGIAAPLVATTVGFFESHRCYARGRAIQNRQHRPRPKPRRPASHPFRRI